MILIAGGEGFIGKRLAAKLDNLDIGLYEIADLKSGTDICDVDGSKYDVIVLLAANLNHDMQMFQDNLRIYRWAMHQTAHIIYTSSAAVYPDTGDEIRGVTEDEYPSAPTWYGKSKLLGEQFIKKACPNYTILRLSNVYGDGDGNGAIDIFKRGGTKIYGKGDDIRDYVPVDVVTEAIKIICLDPKRFNKETYNISSFNPMTTKAAYYSFNSSLKQPQFLPPRGFDTKCSLLDNTKAKKAGLIYEN